jgi:hypothetical protein
LIDAVPSSCSKLNPHFCPCFLSEKCEVVFEQVPSTVLTQTIRGFLFSHHSALADEQPRSPLRSYWVSGYGYGRRTVAGKGGSGKSTTALACLDSPLVYASDHYCSLTNEPAPYVYSLYDSAII